MWKLFHIIKHAWLIKLVKNRHSTIKEVTMSTADNENKLNKPGFGWSNESMFPLTRKGKIALYDSQRR